jgi:hypothetical protein
MQNRMAPIDQVHSRAICDEVADRLRIFLSKDLSDTPVSLKSQILRLKELDQSPSIVPGCGMEYRGKAIHDYPRHRTALLEMGASLG